MRKVAQRFPDNGRLSIISTFHYQYGYIELMLCFVQDTSVEVTEVKLGDTRYGQIVYIFSGKP